MRFAASILTSLALIVPSVAQEATEQPTLSKPLENWKPFLGDWQGKGSVYMTPEMPAMGWTSETRFEPIVGGAAVQETMIIHAGAMGDMQFQSWYGHDADTGRDHVIGLTSMSPGNWADVLWADENTMVSTAFMKAEGHVMADRSVYRKTDEGWTVTMYRSIDGASEFTHVKGHFTRPADGAKVLIDVPSAERAQGELEKLAPLVGAWSMQGSISPMPGMPKMPLKGTETITLGPGGHHLVHHISGTAGAGPLYEAMGASFWDEKLRGYRLLMVDNMGVIASSLGRFVEGGTIVYTSGAPYYGTPSAQRTSLTINEDGTLTVHTDALNGKQDAARTFDATYQRK